MIDPAAARRHARAAERAGKGLSARSAAFLEHDPEKWKPVFPKRSCSAKEHDPEKWKPVFPKSMPSGLTRGIMRYLKVRAPTDSV